MTSAPRLVPVCEVEVLLGEAMDLGTTREGHRRNSPILGGTVKGRDGGELATLRAAILPGGGDRQRIRGDGASGTLIEIDAQYDARTDSGTLLALRARGVRHVPGPDAPGGVLFRVAVQFETSDPELSTLQNGLYVADGVREADRVRHTVYRVA